MHSAKKQKVASFYSKSLPRPHVLLDKEGNAVRDRVDAPEPVTGALLGKCNNGWICAAYALPDRALNGIALTQSGQRMRL